MPASLDVRDQQGAVTGTVVLDEGIFGKQPNVPLMHQVVVGQLAAARAGTQSTKTRAEVSGGGAKPFKQKGTGRARQGSTRAPQFTGGGIALGPKPRKYRPRTPRKMVQAALYGALSDRAAQGRVLVVDNWDWPVPNTKSAKQALEALGVGSGALVVLSRDDELAYKSFRNLPEVDLVLVGELAAYDVLCSEWVVFTRNTVPGNSVWGEAAPAAPGAPKPAPAGRRAAASGGSGKPAAGAAARDSDAGSESTEATAETTDATAESSGAPDEDTGEGD